MAELATGAVSTLLGVIGNEALRLGRVRGDVQFIQEEMESMGSFLANVGGTSRENDEQVRTWMNQVRILANDCNNCIDLYLYRGDPELHRPRARGLRRYLWCWWAPWLLRKMFAQYRAAGQLTELKARARDIGERRLRYGVEVKTEPSSSSSGAGAELTEPLLLPDKQDDHEEEEEEEEEDQHHDHDQDMTTMNMDKEDYLKWKLDHWIGKVVPAAGSKVPLPSIAFLMPKTEDAGAVASQALNIVKDHLKPAEEPNQVEHEKDDGAVRNKIQIKWNVVLVDVPKLHFDHVLLRPVDILYYILHELQHPNSSQSQDQQQCTSPPTPTSPNAKWDVLWSKVTMFWEIRHDIKDTMKLHPKIEKIKENICRVEANEKQKLDKDDKDPKQKISDEPLEQLLWQLVIKSTTAAAAAAEQDQENKDMHTFAEQYEGIIQEAAKKLKGDIEVDASGSKQQAPEYEDILREVFPRLTTTTATANSTNILVDDQIKEIIQGVKEMLHELRELDNYSDKNQETAQARETDFKETTNKKMEEIRRKIEKQLMIKGIVHRIQNCLGGGDKSRILVILKIDDKYVSIWEETINTLSRLGCAAIAGAMIVATKATQRYKKDFCCVELIEYPLVGRFLETVLQYTGQHMHEDIRNILHECEPYEFCMKIFAHALHAKPKRSSEELRKLHTSLQATPKSSRSIARKVFKFSYKDLPKEYKSCLLYLAIFPQGSKIRRSTLIGRWVVEGLITTKDWRWSSSVHEAEKCFDTLITRCLVCPGDTGATGRVKSCMVDKQLYGFITKIATKQRILEARLSDHLARHFSIFSDIRLRVSEQIEDFLQNIPKSSQFSKLKVLDLEGCNCFKKNQQYLRVICRKILMLKYLSLRGTDVTYLPSAINNLLELEVLDIRRTKIHASATRHVLLRKLKRLLAGQVDSSPSSPAEFSSVHIPEKIEKMEDVEILSNVEPRHRRDIKDIARLCTLKKLGLVINNGNHLQQLLEAMGDLLYRGLRSLSITLINIGNTSPGRYPPNLPMSKEKNVLESLSIIGSTQKWELLKRLATNANQLAKVALSGTPLSQEDLNVLATLPNLRCVRLRHIEYTCSKLIFNKGEFQNLNNFRIEGPNITEITFEDGAASKLEKIVWSFTNMNEGAISGIDNLPRIKELEFNGDIAIDGQGGKLTKTKQQEMQNALMWKVKGCCWRN